MKEIIEATYSFMATVGDVLGLLAAACLCAVILVFGLAFYCAYKGPKEHM